MDTFYVHIETRSQKSRKKGTSAQAIEYITDDHDSKRIGNLSDEMIAYIARVDPGYKTDLEGGRVELVGHSALTHLTDVKELEWAFQDWEIPVPQPNIHGEMRPTRGTKGYKSITVTLPKELTLVCETDKAKTRVCVTRAVEQMLTYAYRGKELAAVSAMHTRNEAGEPHLNVHVLIAKYARDRHTNERGSLNTVKFMYGNARDAPRVKRGWTDAVVKELEAAFGISVEYTRKDGCKVRTAEGMALPTMTRATRRERQRAYEMAEAPEITSVNDRGEARVSKLKLGMFDAKILEMASRGGLDEATFTSVFPAQAKTWRVVEKRVATLRGVGYLDAGGRPTRAFLEHAAASFGDNPKLAKLRADVDAWFKARARDRAAGTVGTTGATPPPRAKAKDEEKDEKKGEGKTKAGAPMPMAPPRPPTKDEGKKKKEKKKGDNEKKTKAPAPPPTMPTAKDKDKDGKKKKTQSDDDKKARVDGPNAPRATVPETTPEVTLEDALHAAPIKTASADPWIRDRVAALGMGPEDVAAADAEWALTRAAVTPELREWAEKERELHRFMHESEEKKKTMRPGERAGWETYEKSVAGSLAAGREERFGKAVQSLRHPLAEERRRIVGELKKDRALLASARQAAIRMRNQMKMEMQFARPTEKNYIRKKYETRLAELDRTADKLDREIRAREGRALRMEPEMPDRTGWKRVRGELGRTMDQRTTERVRTIWLRQRGSVKDLLEGKTARQLRQQAAWVKRGIRLMEIQGNPDAKTLGWVGTTATERLVALIAKGKVRGGMAEATMRAMAMGKTMDAAEFNLASRIYPIPPRVRDEGTRRKVRLMMARCDAMGLPAPDIFHLTEAQLWAAIRTNAVLHRMTSEGSSYMVDYRAGDQRNFADGLAVLRRAMSPEPVATGGDRPQAREPSAAERDNRPGGDRTGYPEIP